MLLDVRTIHIPHNNWPRDCMQFQSGRGSRLHTYNHAPQRSLRMILSGYTLQLRKRKNHGWIGT